MSSCKYAMLPVVKTPEVDKGDTVEIDVYFTGTGIPNRNKLYLSYNPKLIDEYDPGEVRTWIGARSDNGVLTPISGDIPVSEFGEDAQVMTEDGPVSVSEVGGILPERFPIRTPGTTVFLLPTLFFQREGLDYTIYDNNSLQFSSHMIKGIMSEASHSGHAPIEIELHTDPSCSSGDYEIPLIFSYTNDEGVFIEKEVPKIHINSFYEANKFELWAVGAVFSLISVVIAAIGVV